MEKFRILVLTAVVCLLFFVHKSEGANILFFFSIGTFSHKQSIWPLVTALADKGHNVSYVSCFDKQPYPHPKVHDLFLSRMAQHMRQQYNYNRLAERKAGREGKIFDEYIDDTINTCQVFLDSAKDDPIANYVIHEAQVDLIVVNVVLGDCGLLLAQKYGAKLIISASTPFLTWIYDEFGFPNEPATIPEMTGVFHYPMGLYDRVRNYFLPLYYYFMRQIKLYPSLERLRRITYGEKASNVPLLDVQRNASLIFVLSHYSTDFARSLPPMVVNVGGMQCWTNTSNKKESQEFKEILDNAKDGVVLIAFGSTINLADMPESFKTIFLETIGHFPEITFIWRWDGPPPENAPRNLRVAKWLPQVQILEHPNTKAFISHAGLNSVTEATFYGVPLILLPLFADQDYNGYRLEAMETGIRVEARDLTTTLLVNSLSDILTNPKYQKNMRRMKEMMRDRIQNPIETAVYYTEFVLRHDTLSLKPLQNQSWFQRRQFDVLLFIFAIVTTAFSLLLLCLLCTCRFIFGKVLAGNVTKKSKQPKIKKK